MKNKSILILISILIIGCQDKIQEKIDTTPIGQTIIIDNSNGEAKDKKGEDNLDRILEMSEKEKSKYNYRIIFEKNVVSILKGKINPSTNIINFNTFIDENKVEFIPVFTSAQDLHNSTNGVNIGEEIEINGYFFLSLLDNSTIIKVNPGLKTSSFTIKSSELKEIFKEEIKNKLQEMNNK